MGFPYDSDGKESAYSQEIQIHPWDRKIPWRREWQLTESHEQEFHESGAWLATVYGIAESDTTEWLTLSLSSSFTKFYGEDSFLSNVDVFLH